MLRFSNTGAQEILSLSFGYTGAGPARVRRDILIFQKNLPFSFKNGKMSRDYLANPLPPPCGVW